MNQHLHGGGVMTMIEYAELVAKMRSLQKRFFSGERTGELIEQSKRLERKVDRATDEILNPPPPGLFDEVKPMALENH